MSTAAQVAEIVQPFLERHPDFVLVGRSVVMKPVGHFMRRFYLDRASPKGYVQPSWSVATMFGPPPNHLSGAGTRLVRGVGYVDDPRVRAWLLDEMELIASEILREADMDSLPALAWKAEPIFGPGPMTFAMPLLAKGAFAEAAPYLAQTLARIDGAVERQEATVKDHRSPDSRRARIDSNVLGRQREAQDGLRTLCGLLSAVDAPAIAALLHAWEASAVRVHKVEHLWKPSPFSFEVGS
nr:hypothetical protein [uncultured Devosia sp.]